MREQEKAKCRDCELPFEECWCRAWDKLHGIRPAASPEPQPAPVEPELACTDCKEYRAKMAGEIDGLKRSMVEHFQRDHLAGDGPEIDRWKRENAALRERVKLAEEGLQAVIAWQMPRTGKRWCGAPIHAPHAEGCHGCNGESSFAAEYGSNGERDHIRAVALAAYRASQGEPK